MGPCKPWLMGGGEFSRWRYDAEDPNTSLSAGFDHAPMPTRPNSMFKHIYHEAALRAVEGDVALGAQGPRGQVLRFDRSRLEFVPHKLEYPDGVRSWNKYVLTSLSKRTTTQQRR